MKGFLKKLAVAALIPLVMGLVAGGGVGVWYLFLRQTPEKVFDGLISHARQRNAEKFREAFTDSSIQAMEQSWTGETFGDQGSWNEMMASILEVDGAPPTYKKPKFNKDETLAELDVQLRDGRQTINFVKEKGSWYQIDRWKINVLFGIDAGLSAQARKEQAKAKNEAESKKDGEGGGAQIQIEAPQEDGWGKELQGGEKPKEEKPK
jgi:hypothetical protein